MLTSQTLLPILSAIHRTPQTPAQSRAVLVPLMGEDGDYLPWSLDLSAPSPTLSSLAFCVLRGQVYLQLSPSVDEGMVTGAFP